VSGGSHLLKIFPGDEAPPVRLEVLLRREGDTILLCYLLRGELSSLAIPEKVARPERRDHLWLQTCFELFLAPAEGNNYWELNVSPAGHWNLYGFDDYRFGMRPAPVSSFSFTVVRETSSLAVLLELPLGMLPGLAGGGLVAGLSAVLATGKGALSHWALCHPETGPDFHQRNFFTVNI
jgi:hypothetical protein